MRDVAHFRDVFMPAYIVWGLVVILQWGGGHQPGPASSAVLAAGAPIAHPFNPFLMLACGHLDSIGKGQAPGSSSQ